MVSRKTERGCFGTKEFSVKSIICYQCLDYQLCGKARYKKFGSINNGVVKVSKTIKVTKGRV